MTLVHVYSEETFENVRFNLGGRGHVYNKTYDYYRSYYDTVYWTPDPLTEQIRKETCWSLPSQVVYHIQLIYK